MIRTGLTLLLLQTLVSANQTLQKESRYPNGAVKERYSYSMDEKGREVKHGPYEEFFPDGSKKGVINWYEGSENGQVLYYYSNGRKSYEANYAKGRKSGFATVWYENGQRQWQTTFHNGKTNGVWREWFPDGKKKFEANYRDGKLDGIASWFHGNGRVRQERVYTAGQQVKGSVKEWDREGAQTYPPPDKELLAETTESDAAPSDSGSATKQLQNTP